ncbi:MAG: hypothetical protein G01um101438_575 [Parcubacteria group bacterium Gr01-1014_38]|nr:MAG: hypothetical protein G01um101438_575 [Parcubacteria group bacterium Gr01-1014_38]
MADVRLATISGWSERRGQLRGVVLLVITALIFYLLFRRIDLMSVLQTLATIPFRTWRAAFLLTISFPMLSALRWHYTLKAIGHRVSILRCLKIILGTSPISAIAPSKAGDLLKALSLRGEISLLEVGGTVLAERVLDVIVLAALALAGGIVVGNSLITRLAVAIVGAGIAGLLLLPMLVASIKKPKLREKLERLIRVLHALRAQPSKAFAIALFTVLNWLASIVQTHLLLLAVGAHPPFWLTAAALPIAIFIGLIPITIGGMGTRDAALVTLLASAATAPQALSVGLLYSFFGYWLLAILGLPFMKSALFRNRNQRS